jgi:hypothetical protein
MLSLIDHSDLFRICIFHHHSDSLNQRSLQFVKFGKLPEPSNYKKFQF